MPSLFFVAGAGRDKARPALTMVFCKITSELAKLKIRVVDIWDGT